MEALARQKPLFVHDLAEANRELALHEQARLEKISRALHMVETRTADPRMLAVNPADGKAFFRIAWGLGYAISTKRFGDEARAYHKADNNDARIMRERMKGA